MVGALHGPWLYGAALLLLGAALRNGPRPRRQELWSIAALLGVAAAPRLLFGLWGPLHVNGQGPLWIRGALTPDALAAYGPGYFELFGWVASAGLAPDRAVFGANALLSGLSPAALYATARLAGAERIGALAAGLVLAADAVSIRAAASEGYFSSLILVVLGVQMSLALASRAHGRGDRAARNLSLVAAAVLAAAAARIHPMAYLPLALSPLIVLCGAEPGAWRTRFALAAASAAVIAMVVLATSANVVFTALRGSPMAEQAVSHAAPPDSALLLALLAAAVLLHRWARPPWLPLIGVCSLALMLATQESFQQHPFWKLCYQRLFLPGMLLGGAPLLAMRSVRTLWALAATAPLAVALLIPALPHLGRPTTEQLEYRFLQDVLRDAPRDCMVAGVSSAGKRVWEIPGYLAARRGRSGMQRNVQSPADVEAIAPGDCFLYVRSSLCTSAEARSLCESVEREANLERVAERVFPAVPSYTDLPYDRPEVEVVVFRPIARAPTAERTRAAVSDGAAITPALAQSIYDRLVPLRESDGCRLVRFDTSRFRIALALRTASGSELAFELATAPAGDTPRRVGGWALAVTPEIERECGASLAAIERVLTAEPAR